MCFHYRDDWSSEEKVVIKENIAKFKRQSAAILQNQSVTEYLREGKHDHPSGNQGSELNKFRSKDVGSLR